MWTCSMCGREFKKKNQSHYCRSINSIDEYIVLYSPTEQAKLKELREMIKNIAPYAEEKISWKMPTFVQNGNLVHFAMHQNHIGFYVGASTVKAFENQLAYYTFSKGTIQFPKNEPLPYQLIKEMILFNIEKNRI
ncbi:iron chaperone [Pseudogracilibacillus auburnensis]|uniref:iron chaperone n=1 Tax=Pseudogracilibacillus auburnensis TaxID=1494959 RepID=UPI001F620B3B|nr:DUF1801 domain-containing protein [Pseudogracilibacillus auburnensis]